MKIGQIQMGVTGDKTLDILRACRSIREAAGQGAELAVLPEMFCCPYDNKFFREYGEAAGGEAQQALSQLARELGIWIVGGSVPELEDGKVYNTSFVYDPEGKQVAKHRKTHLFDIAVDGGQVFRESDVLSAGSDVTVFDTPWGKMGLCICFDFRFEELSRLMALEGAKVIFVPAAFNETTGPAHWELLFRQRAVDNQLFTVGVSPALSCAEKAEIDPEKRVSWDYRAWGHSMICSPWGKVLRDCGREECIAVTEIDLGEVDAVRRQLPILSARREDVYEIHRKELR